MWHSATCSFSNICNLILRLSWAFIATYHLFGTIGPCNTSRNSIRTVEAFVPSKCNSVLSTCGFLPERWKESRPYSSLLATQQSVLETQGKVVQSPFLSELVNRGIISQATDLQGLDAFLCSYESGNASSHDPIPAIYYGMSVLYYTILLCRHRLNQQLHSRGDTVPAVCAASFLSPQVQRCDNPRWRNHYSW